MRVLEVAAGKVKLPSNCRLPIAFSLLPLLPLMLRAPANFAFWATT